MDLVTVPYEDFLKLCNVVLTSCNQASKEMDAGNMNGAKQLMDELHEGFCKVKFRAIDLQITDGKGW